jgi:hypothetical protein
VPRFVLTIGPISLVLPEKVVVVLHCLFMGISTSLSSPYTPKISRRCASVTFLVSFSTTIFALRCGGGGLRSALRGDRDRLGERDARCGRGERDGEREAVRGVMERRGVRDRDLDGDGMVVILCSIIVVVFEVESNVNVTRGREEDHRLAETHVRVH